MASMNPGLRMTGSMRSRIGHLREPTLLEDPLRARHVGAPYEKIDIHIRPETIGIERARDRRPSQEDASNARARKRRRYVNRNAVSRQACAEPTSRVNELRIVAELHRARLQHNEAGRDG